MIKGSKNIKNMIKVLKIWLLLLISGTNNVKKNEIVSMLRNDISWISSDYLFFFFFFCQILPSTFQRKYNIFEDIIPFILKA